MNKWQSEQWSDFVSVAGAVIGWTRGTGLMDTNNMLAASIESCGVRTFSASEMALNIMTLLHPQMVSMAGLEPVWADFGGDFNKVERLNELASKIRKDVRGVRARSARISLFLFTYSEDSLVSRTQPISLTRVTLLCPHSQQYHLNVTEILNSRFALENRYDLVILHTLHLDVSDLTSTL